jgi:hypothetical protein
VEADFYVVSVAGIYAGHRPPQDDADTMYYGGYSSGSGNWEIYKVVAGSYTSLGTYAQTLTPTTTYAVKFQIRNASKKLFIDGVERISSADNALATIGHRSARERRVDDDRHSRRQLRRDGRMSVTWDPLVQQEIESDTLFLLDPDVEATFTPGDGGLVMMNAPNGDLTPWEDAGSKISVVAGKFRDGLKANHVDGGIVMPFFLPADEWTIEAWAKCDANWSSLGADQYIVWCGERFENFVRLHISATGVVTLRMKHVQTAAGTNTVLTYNASAFLSGAWHHLAATFDHGTLKLYVDGVERSSVGSVPAPRVWGYTMRGDGLVIADLAGEAATLTTISDLRISRAARVPSVPVEIPSRSTITLGAETGGTVNKEIPSTIHGYGGTAEGKAGLSEILYCIRTDKAISACPIKAGGTDGTHTELGHSGEYSYDWRPWRHTLDYIEARGARLYWGVDSTPQVLGGDVAPYSGSQLTNPEQLTGYSGFSSGPPSDVDAFATIAGDFLHLCITEYPGLIEYATIWNEYTIYGAMSDATYHALYAAVVPVLKAIHPTLKIGGTEAGLAWDQRAQATGLINYCADNDLPLDALSGHFYDGNHATFVQWKLLCEATLTARGMPAVDYLNGESTYQVANGYLTGQYPFRDFEWFLNIWGRGVRREDAPRDERARLQARRVHVLGR